MRASSMHPVRDLQELPATVCGVPEASSIRWIMSTTVVFPLVPVTAATRASSPRSSRPSPTSEIMGTPRSFADRSTGLWGLMPGLATNLSTPSRTSRPAPRTPDTSSPARVSRRPSLSLASATTTYSPRSMSTRVAATPDSPSPNTSVFTGSPCRVVEEDVVEEEAHRGEGGLGDPEPHHDLVLIPSQEFEVVVYRGHLEDPTPRELVDEDLHHDGDRLHHEETTDDGEQKLGLGQHRRGGEHAAYRQRARVAHEDLGWMGVVPEEPHDRSDHRTADHRHVVQALEKGDRRVRQERYGPSPRREPVQAVGKVDRVGGP